MRPLPQPATTTTAIMRRKPHAMPYCRRRSWRMAASVKRFSLKGAKREVGASCYETNCLPRRRMLHEAPRGHENNFTEFVVVLTKLWRAHPGGPASACSVESSTSYALHQRIVVEVLTRRLERDEVLLHRAGEDVREAIERPALGVMDPHERPVVAEQHDFLAAHPEDLTAHILRGIGAE